MKKENWNTLNRKILAKINIKLSKNTIHLLANASRDAIEKFLSKLKTKISRDAQGDEAQVKTQIHRGGYRRSNVTNLFIDICDISIGFCHIYSYFPRFTVTKNL